MRPSDTLASFVVVVVALPDAEQVPSEDTPFSLDDLCALSAPEDQTSAPVVWAISQPLAPSDSIASVLSQGKFAMNRFVFSCADNALFGASAAIVTNLGVPEHVGVDNPDQCVNTWYTRERYENNLWIVSSKTT
jgi:hypothetical protein